MKIVHARISFRLSILSINITAADVVKKKPYWSSLSIRWQDKAKGEANLTPCRLLKASGF